jgi:DNA-binding CsgD family transcriptional regulator
LKELKSFSTLVADLYDAAVGNAPFWSLGPRIAAELNSESCAANVLNGRAGPVEALTWTDNCIEMLPRYYGHFHKLDIWAQEGAKQPPEKMVATQEFIADGTFRQTEFYQDCSRHFGMFRALGVIIPLDTTNASHLMISIHRDEAATPFDDYEKQYGTLLIPHLKRAMQLRERIANLELQKQSFSEATSILGVAVLAVSSDARIIFANHAAEMLLRRNTALLVKNGRLYASRPAATDRLLTTIKQAAENNLAKDWNGTSLLRIARQGARPLVLSVYPFPAILGSGLETTTRMALIYASDPDLAPLPTRAALTQMYSLTVAEAKLFEALLNGDTIQRYAEKRGIGLQTARTQLSHIFQKTGFSRQTDLVKDALHNLALRIP